MSLTSVQLNVRLEKDLKQRGDAALEEAGLTATQIVRMLWKKLARRGDSVQAVLNVLEDGASTKEERVDHNVELARKGALLFDEGLERLGLSGCALGVGDLMDGATWKDVREELIEERLRERGVV